MGDLFLKMYVCTYVCTYITVMSGSGMLILRRNVAGFLPANLVSFATRCLQGMQSTSYMWSQTVSAVGICLYHNSTIVLTVARG